MRFTKHLLLFVLLIISIDGWTQNLLVEFNLNQLHYKKINRSFSPSGNLQYLDIDHFDGDFSIGYQTNKHVFRAIIGVGNWSQNRVVQENIREYEQVITRIGTRKTHLFGIGVEKPYIHDKLQFNIGVNALFHTRNPLVASSPGNATDNNGTEVVSSLLESIGRKNHSIQLHLISRMYYEILPNLSVGLRLRLVLSYLFFDDGYYVSYTRYENQILTYDSSEYISQKGFLFSQYVPSVNLGLKYQINWKKKSNIGCSVMRQK